MDRDVGASAFPTVRWRLANAIGLCAATIVLVGCDPAGSILTITNGCETAQSIAVQPGFDPRRTDAELEDSTAVLAPGASYVSSSLSKGEDFYLILAPGTSEERLEILTVSSDERNAAYTIGDTDCIEAGD